MIVLRKSGERGHVSQDWLDSYHSFSFANYYDPQHMGFSALRVINEDRVQPAEGFPDHPHRDMEIITYVLEGALQHRDSMGNGSIIRPDDVQRMSAGKGIVHSEFNSSDKDVVHLLQIWILPDKRGIQPGYEQKTFPRESKLNRLKLIASSDGNEGSVTIHQDAKVYASVLEKGKSLHFPLNKKRHYWIQAIKGSFEANSASLIEGDAAAFTSEQNLVFKSNDESELILFDLP